MILKINKNEYLLPSNSKITTYKAYVIIDEVEFLPFTYAKIPASPHRLVIQFDQTRTARWFAEVIKEGVISSRRELRIEKISQWNFEYPFGYKYIII